LSDGVPDAAVGSYAGAFGRRNEIPEIVADIEQDAIGLSDVAPAAFFIGISVGLFALGKKIAGIGLERKTQRFEVGYRVTCCPSRRRYGFSTGIKFGSDRGPPNSIPEREVDHHQVEVQARWPERGRRRWKWRRLAEHIEWE
jgi:hypothetical protein